MSDDKRRDKRWLKKCEKLVVSKVRLNNAISHVSLFENILEDISNFFKCFMISSSDVNYDLNNSIA